MGATSSDRIDTLVHDLVEVSDAAGDIVQSPHFAEALLELRGFMFEHIYLGPTARSENTDAAAMVEALFNHHIAANPDPIAVADWVSGMTDRYAVRAYTELV